jgi:hypothetical protein
VCVLIQRVELSRAGLGASYQIGGIDQLVEKTGTQCRFGVEVFRQGDRTLEGSRVESVAQHGRCNARHGHADCHFVGRDFEIATTADHIVD